MATLNILELLRDNANEKADKLALKDSNRQLTYQELFFEVLEKSSFIKECGFNNSPIVVKVNRSLDVVVTFFSILLSGNYYIPVDEDIPNYKLEKIIKASSAKAFIAFNDEQLAIPRIHFSEPKNSLRFEYFAKEFDENKYAYIMFTSGSTGEPKGVIKTIKNINAFVDNFTSNFPYILEENIANQAPFFFDASMKDIYLSLKLGATLFIPDKTVFSLPMETINYLNKNKITMIYWVPSILSMIAKTRTLNYVKPEYLKYVFFVGEVFPPKYLNMWIESLPNIQYFNTYGSTEVMGVVATYEIKSRIEDEYIPIGKAIFGNTLKLDNEEIIVESEQVALRYLNVENNQTFEHHDDIHRLRTGDYGRYDEDGNIVFVSRKDFQIKHLGYRIELQEIENAINDFSYIDQSCAVYNGEKDLIYLFVVLNQELDNPTKTILNDAKEKLQFYMIPNKVVVLDKMPLNKNGKIDRTELKGKAM